MDSVRRSWARIGLCAGLLAVLLVCRVRSSEASCADCDGDGRFDTVDWKHALASSLGAAECGGADFDGDGAVHVEELVRLAIAVPACGFVTPTPTRTATSTVTPSPTQAPGGDQLPPTQAQALLAWLREGRYLGWHAESAIHPSGGPHFGRVRTYLNDLAFDSLVAGNEQHPAGTAVVKELYHQGSTIQEWAVEIKLEADSAQGAGKVADGGFGRGKAW